MDRSNTILVVDHEPIALTYCLSVLSEAGHVVIVTTEGAEALDMCKEDPLKVDVALVDAELPGGTGPEVADCLKDTGIKVVLMAAFSEQELIERSGRSVRYDRYLSKPLASATLLETVRQILAEPKVRTV